MTLNHRPRGQHLTAILAAATLFSIACSEANRASIVENPVPVVEATLVVSDMAPPAGSTLVVSMQATATDGTVGSYTARINYDSTALRYDGEVALTDQGLRANNPTPGLLRFAGAAPTGFAGGRLASYRFVVLKANSVRTLSLVVDEMHMLSRFDAKAELKLAPTRMSPR